jgi:hypothetical protein
MARRPSLGEILLGGGVIALVAFVASQVVASPTEFGSKRVRALTGRDSVTIAEQYRSQLSAREGSYDVPAWLAAVQIGRLQAAAGRELAGLDAVPAMAPDSVQLVLAAAANGSYLRAMLAEDGDVVTRWRERPEPIRVWVQPQSTEPGFSPDLVSPTRRAFLAWNELALGVAFEMIDDSTQADVHVTWRAQMVNAKQLGTTFRMTAGSGWVAFAHVILSTSYDIYTVQNAARHEAGHVLGLDHSPDRRDIMAAETEGRQYQLTDADRQTAAWLYRLPVGRVRP